MRSSTFRLALDDTVTSPSGFLAGAAQAKLKTGGKSGLDLGLLYSEMPCVAAGTFTANKIKAAPVVLCQRHLANRRAQAIIVNSGCANACTGQQGLVNAAEMATLAAKRLGIAAEDVLVASTGVIGTSLPMELIRTGIEKIALSEKGGHELALSIMTTDTFPKEVAVELEIDHRKVTIGGVAKGAGMIHPDLATLFCFMTTDAAVEADFLQKVLQKAVDDSFNMITIDGDTSPNDTVLLLANGLAGNKVIRANTPEAEAFQAAVQEVCLYLARCIVRGGEGATKLIEVIVEGALSLGDARIAARSIAGSSLVKAAMHGGDPNWGRIITALGRSGAQIVESKIDLYLRDLQLLKSGCPLTFDKETAITLLSNAEVPIRVCLNLGKGSATAWGCDLSEEYVTINSAYTT
jgi:glutamate N-acetyltransferase/amino-acid N-acetyltransferase